MNKLIIASMLVLTGCNDRENLVTDQCLRITLIQQCMKDIPKPPNATHYSDWDEVVKQCDSNSAYQSMRKKAFVKPECAV